MSTIESKSFSNLEKGFRIFSGDHGFEEFSSTMLTAKVAMLPCHTDRCKAVFLSGKAPIMIRDGARNGEGEFVAEMGPPNSESLGLKVA
jgi:hypothetical protein